MLRPCRDPARHVGRRACAWCVVAQVLVLNEALKPHMSEAQVLNMVSKADEFSNMMVRVCA